MDNELFDLCKEVYKRTKWWYPMTESHEYYTNFNPRDKHDRTWRVKRYFGPKDKTGEQMFPLYTSDYLLEKLPGIRIDVWNDGHVIIKKQLHDGVPENVERKYGDTVKVEADTVLKALLKLVLALNDAGIKL
jgi:hypothetical protein